MFLQFAWGNICSTVSTLGKGLLEMSKYHMYMLRVNGRCSLLITLIYWQLIDPHLIFYCLVTIPGFSRAVGPTLNDFIAISLEDSHHSSSHLLSWKGGHCSSRWIYHVLDIFTFMSSVPKISGHQAHVQHLLCVCDRVGTCASAECVCVCVFSYCLHLYALTHMWSSAMLSLCWPVNHSLEVSEGVWPRPSLSQLSASSVREVKGCSTRVNMSGEKSVPQQHLSAVIGEGRLSCLCIWNVPIHTLENVYVCQGQR